MVIDPISILSIILTQIGSKHLNLDITKAQEKMIKHPIFQSIIFFSIIYISTKNIYISFTILILTYLVLKILFNENHKYNILSKSWLKNEGLINDADIISAKNLYRDYIESINI